MIGFVSVIGQQNDNFCPRANSIAEVNLNGNAHRFRSIRARPIAAHAGKFQNRPFIGL